MSGHRTVLPSHNLFLALEMRNGFRDPCFGSNGGVFIEVVYHQYVLSAVQACR